jgi:probable F420-dependent oxidoreductase
MLGSMSGVRISVQAEPRDLPSWLDLAREVEQAGFGALLVADHPGSGAEPWQSLAAAATVTSALRLGTYVVQAGVREPHHIAADALTLDRLAPGRVILGLGAGHTPAEWSAVGRTRPSPSDRVGRLVESVSVIKALLAGRVADLEGDHITVAGASVERVEGQRGDVTLLVGGGNRRLLELAASEADIVGLSGLGRTRADGHYHETRWAPHQVQAQLDLVHATAAAAGRSPEVEVLVQRVELTNDREAALDSLVKELDGLSVDEAAQAPYLLIGTAEEIVAQLRRQAEDWGITRCVIRKDAIPAIAPLLPALA